MKRSSFLHLTRTSNQPFHISSSWAGSPVVSVHRPGAKEMRNISSGASLFTLCYFIIKQPNHVLGWVATYYLFIFLLLSLNPAHNEAFITEHILFLSDETAADSTAALLLCCVSHNRTHTPHTNAHQPCSLPFRDRERAREKGGYALMSQCGAVLCLIR